MDKQVINILGVRGFIDDNGTAQLNLEDVARGLGFVETKGAREYVMWRRVDSYLVDLSFGTSAENEFIPENIFYRLAMKAKNETAEAFQVKVADEILPTIRKHGAYMTPAKIEEVLLNPDTIIQLATQLKQERIARITAETKVEQQAPLVSLAETFMQSDKSIKVRDLAHQVSSHGIKIGQNRLFGRLREWEMICKKSTEPTQTAIERGLFEIVTGIKEKPDGTPFVWRTPYVTPKGQTYIINRLKKEIP